MAEGGYTEQQLQPQPDIERIMQEMKQEERLFPNTGADEYIQMLLGEAN